MKEEGLESSQKRPIIVEYLDLRWFFKGFKNFISFSLILDDMPTSFYTSKFTELLLEQFWD